MKYTVSKSNRQIVGALTLAGSKSISNRALIMRALSNTDFPLHKLANANDTDLLQKLLQHQGPVYDAGPAGTTFRFLTAYLSLQEGTQELTGTERMKQRPIAVLVEALRSLGANIDYLEKEGYPPLRIGEPDDLGIKRDVSISASTSSQYISALLMIAPTLPFGLEVKLEGKIVSRPYIEMTLKMMAYFGIQHEWEGQNIFIAPQTYQARPFTIEADWSAASYYYAMAAFADELDLQLDGLFSESVQGDAVLAEMMEQFGVKTTFNETGLRLTKSGASLPDTFEWDFVRCPDLAQTLAVICAGTGVRGVFTGLETLRIKETDRINALQVELAKIGGTMELLEVRDGKEYFEVKGPVKVEGTPVFATYEDHRMAMAFAPLAMLGSLQVEEPAVVGKSYPDFWRDLEKIGFTVAE